MQVKPLVLRSTSFEMEIHDHIVKCSDLASSLGKSMLEGKSTAAKGFNQLRTTIMKKLKSHRWNWIQCRLMHQLYLVMPETHDQLKMLPNLSILVLGKHQVKVHNAIRTKTRPKAAKQRKQDNMPMLEKMVQRM